jgi:hypothetical protein
MVATATIAPMKPMFARCGLASTIHLSPKLNVSLLAVTGLPPRATA